MEKKSDAVVYTTIDRKTLAKIAIHIQENGKHLKSMSEMLRIVVDIFESWIDRNGAKPITSTHEATNILQNMFRASLNPGNRLKHKLLENLQEDEAKWLPEADASSDAIKVPDQQMLAVAMAHAKKLGLQIEEPKRILPENIKEMVAASIAQQNASTKAEQLTSLQIERNKTINAILQHWIEHYKSKIAQYKTDKAQEPFQKGLFKIIKLAKEAETSAIALKQLEEWNE
jgi:uncharacterized damage-inducible protein DinB